MIYNLEYPEEQTCNDFLNPIINHILKYPQDHTFAVEYLPHAAIYTISRTDTSILYCSFTIIKTVGVVYPSIKFSISTNSTVHAEFSEVIINIGNTGDGELFDNAINMMLLCDLVAKEKLYKEFDKIIMYEMVQTSGKADTLASEIKKN